MAAVGAIGSQVGLALLLQPLTSTVVVRAACTVLGVGYPVYASCRTIEENRTETNAALRTRREAQWLTYWAIYGSFTVIESATDKLLAWCPLYYHLKLAVLLWLQLPQFQGARRLYRDFLRPFLYKHHLQVERIVAVLRCIVARPELGALVRQLRQATQGVPVLSWLLRDPDQDEL